MAEGDSIRRLARWIGPTLVGRPISSAAAPSPRSPLRRGPGSTVKALEGRVAERVEARGKHLLIHFDQGLSLHSHLGMNGSWRSESPGSPFGRPDHAAWLLLDLGDRRVAQFGGPTLRLASTAALARDRRLASLGPDVLDRDFDPEGGAARLEASPEQIGVALLDQRLLAGIGNIFKSEACFEAEVDPFRPAGSLSREEAAAVVGAARRQMLEAVETGRRPGRVYRRAGRPCPRCGRAELRSAPQGADARTTYWCPACQR